MELSHRDLDVLKLTYTFVQLDSTQLAELLFAEVSRTVTNKVLGRLKETGYLSRVGRRTPGDKGGNSPFVYKLGRYGRTLLGAEGRQSVAVNDHALMIADTYVALRRAEKTGVLVVRSWEVERPLPPVRTDLSVSVDYPGQRRSSSYYLEIDLGTEAPIRLREKIAGYWRAYQRGEDEFFPFVVFVVKREARKREIERIIRALPEEQQEMVRVYLFGELVPELMKL
ncbi:replication-relaxation family protein [Streptomyces sp. NPDC003688]